MWRKWTLTPIRTATPQNVVGAANAVLTAVGAGLPVPAVNAIASTIGFIQDPTLENGANTALWVAACVPGPARRRMRRTHLRPCSRRWVADLHVNTTTAIDAARTDRFLRRMGFAQTGGNYVLEGV